VSLTDQILCQTNTVRWNERLVQHLQVTHCMQQKAKFNNTSSILVQLFRVFYDCGRSFRAPSLASLSAASLPAMPL